LNDWTLKKDGIQLLLSKPWRFIICTPENSGIQKREKNQPKTNLKIKLKIKSQGLKNFLINNLTNLSIALAGGALILIIWQGELSLVIPKAKAADSMSANLTLAREVIADIKPTIVDGKMSKSDLAIPSVPDGFLDKPLTPETKVTKEEPKVTQKSNSLKASVAKIANGVTASRFPYGYCTYYVSQQRFIPWSGNAIAWLSGARSFGYATGNIPQVGAIIVTSEGGRTGHVGMVDGVGGDEITITEMNYHGFGVISSRTISASYGRIMGYIY